MPKLTKREVDAAAPEPGKRSFLWDDQIPGYGLMLTPAGSRSFVYQFRNGSGATRRVTLGRYGKLTADEARKKAEQMRRAVADGRDPAEEKKAAKSAATVADLFDAYLDSQTFAGKADSTKATDRGRIERHLRPLIGKVKADALTVEAVKRAQAAIRDGKTAIREKTGPRGLARVTGGEGAARKSIRLLAAILRWAQAEGMVKENVAAAIKVSPDGNRDTILEGAEDYARLFQTLDRMETERRIRSELADAIRFIALTGCRRGEAAGMRWAHVDLRDGIVTLPVSAHKTGAKTGKPRVIALPAVAAAIIAQQPEGAPGDYVFRAAKGTGPIVLSNSWRKIRAEAELPEGIGLHGLRHSAASHMAMAGAQAAEIMQAMGHRNMSTAQKYVHWAQDARQAVAEKAASVALAGMAQAKGEAPAEVVALRGRADD
jgi:integrase